jgi:hypothetical protein
MVKNKPNRPLSRLINHFNKDAPPSDTQHLTISPPQDSIGRSLSPTVSCIARNLPASDKLSRKLSSVSLNPRPLGIDATPWSVPSIWALARDSTPFRVRRMHSCGNPACTNQPPRISQPGIYSLWPQGVLVLLYLLEFLQLLLHGLIGHRQPLDLCLLARYRLRLLLADFILFFERFNN